MIRPLIGATLVFLLLAMVVVVTIAAVRSVDCREAGGIMVSGVCIAFEEVPL